MCGRDARRRTGRGDAPHVGIPPLDDPGFRSDPLLGGGALFDCGSYPVAAVAELFPGERAHVLWAGVSARDGSTVDTDGACVVGLSGGATALLEWRINAAYRNEIDIWGTHGSLRTDRFFSKPADHVPVFQLRDLHGHETAEPGSAADHFELMLAAFARATGDPEASEAERVRIQGRAELLEQIAVSARGRSAGD